MKKLLLGLALVVLALGALAFVYRHQLGAMALFWSIRPEQTFADSTPPPAPDYSSDQAWAALPERSDPADVTPSAEIVDRQSSAAVDVFFLHPTTLYSKAHWNQPLEDAGVNEITDYFVLRSQASVFNSCCKVYAPRYRQATLYSFADMEGDGAAALELAYADVERAFDYFIEHYSQGRPFVLAGHSQGSRHLRTLLEQRITGTPLRERLIAAYPIGFNLDRESAAAALPDIPVCESAEQLGCLVAWNAVGPKVRPFGEAHKNICVNPLTWRTDDAYAAHELNLGAVAYPSAAKVSLSKLDGVPQEYIDAKPVLERGVADAQCKDGLLWVREIRSPHYAARPLGRDNYHLYDYHLFHMNLRKNVEMKVDRYLTRAAGSGS